MDFGKVFLGSTPADHRRFITAALAHLHSHGARRVIVPCCGQFTLVKCAITAGFDKKDILASDVSLFSSLLGYYYAGRPLSELPFTIKPGRLAEEYERCDSDASRLALLLLYMKLSQLRTDRDFERRYADDLTGNAGEHTSRMRQALETFREFYSGITYGIEDLRKVTEHDGPDTVILLNPPAYAGGYTKMFKKIGEVIDFRVQIDEWNARKEYRAFYDSLKGMSAPCFIYRCNDTAGFDPRDVVFANEAGPKRVDYWLCTKPEVLQGWTHTGSVKLKPSHPSRPYHHVPMFSDADTLTVDSEVRFAVVKEEPALYYRDLLAHRLGDTKAELYVLCLIGGKMFSVAGFHSQKLRIGQENYIAETFGFTVRLERYPDANRLLMYLITCEEFSRFLQSHMTHKNRTYEMRGLKTTCLSKYRKVKRNNGILPVIFREKLAKGAFADMYRIVHQVDWYRRSYTDCIRLYLGEQEKKSK
jgi:hypothetical protein